MEEHEWGLFERELVKQNPLGCTRYQMKILAKEFDISYKAAVRMRVRYLVDQLWYWPRYIEENVFGVYIPTGTFVVPYASIPEITDEILNLQKPDEPDHANTITEEMKQRAKEYPIDRLLNFKNGKVRCINPLHTDIHATQFNGTKLNRAVCPGCQANYDSIDVLMILEDLTFSQAVKELCRR